MTEDQLLAEITGLASQLGLLAFHVPDSRKVVTGRGFPDLVIAGRGGLLFAELKDDDSVLSPGQTRWKWVLKAAGQEWRLWRPATWKSGVIHSQLRSIL